jgi:hypothetical protein
VPKYIFAGGAFRLVPDDAPSDLVLKFGRNRRFDLKRAQPTSLKRSTTKLRVR